MPQIFISSMNNANGPKHLLFEHISGYELFELKSFESLANESYMDYVALTQVVRHVSSLPFTSAEDTITHFDASSPGDSQLPLELASFFTLNRVTVLFADKHYRQLLDPLGIEYQSAPEIMRGVRANIHKFTARPLDIQLLRSVAHTLSRDAIRYNMEREDNLAIAVGFECDELEAEINSLGSRMSGLIDWAVPHLKKLAKGEEYNNELERAIFRELNGQDASVATETPKNLLDELKTIKNISEEDLSYVKSLNDSIIAKRKLLSDLRSYLSSKMQVLAPNLSTILGDQLTYKLIHKAGSLMNLALMPASTLQLLGAEKSLFRSLKMRSKTPKYGLLREFGTMKGGRGRICRFVATKCSLAARLDAFSKERSNTYGKELKKLIDKRTSMGPYGKHIERSEDLFKRVSKLAGSAPSSKRPEPKLSHSNSGSTKKQENTSLKATKKDERDKKPVTSNKDSVTNKATASQKTAPTAFDKTTKRKSPYEMTKSAKNKVMEKNDSRKKSKK